MPHDLYMDNDKARMMFVDELPWHGLGTPLDGPATSAEAIKAAGLDWTVRKVPLFAIEGTGVVPLNAHKGIVPEDRWGKPDCPVFGIVGRDYQPLQNVEAFEFFDSVVGGAKAIYHTAGALGKGERIWILAKLNDMMEVTESDMLENYVLLSTGHDGRTAIKITLTPVRVVCQNTLTVALSRGHEIARAHHNRNMGRHLDHARSQIRSLMNGFANLQDSFRAMTQYPMDDKAVERYVERVFPLPARTDDSKKAERVNIERDKCAQLFRHGKGNDDSEARGTLWAAYNGVTEYVDHWRSRSKQRHMHNVCFGNGYRIKNRAFQLANEIMGRFTQN